MRVTTFRTESSDFVNSQGRSSAAAAAAAAAAAVTDYDDDDDDDDDCDTDDPAAPRSCAFPNKRAKVDGGGNVIFNRI